MWIARYWEDWGILYPSVRLHGIFVALPAAERTKSGAFCGAERRDRGAGMLRAEKGMGLY
jgi:hypothetical protein